MSFVTSSADLFRSAWHVLRRSLRRAVLPAVRPVLRRMLRTSARGWTLSVIVPVHDVDRYLSDCLDSVLAQEVEAMEVIVVDDGSTDGSPRILAHYAARDPRIRVFRQERAGQGAARNAGVSRARGEFITFLDADDRVPTGSYRAMLASLARSRSDFVVGAARRFGAGGSHAPSWNATVHDRDRTAITIDDFPAALLDVIACNRMLRRSFWTDVVGGFPTGILYEDHVPMVAAYVRAARFDLLSRVTYEWRLREDRSSTGQRKHERQNLSDRVKVKADALRLVTDEASDAVQAAWLGRVLDLDFPAYIDHALRSDEAYRELLQGALAGYVARVTPEALAHVRVHQKVRSYLASRGAWADVEVVNAVFRSESNIPSTTTRGDRIVADAALFRDLAEPVPEELLELSDRETRLQAWLLRSRWTGPATLELTGWAVIRALDLSGRSPTLTLALVAADDMRRHEVPVERIRTAQATRTVNWPHGSFEDAGFRAVLDVSLLRADHPDGVWRLSLRVDIDGIVREGGLYHAVAGSPATRAAITSQRVDANGIVAVPFFDGEHGLSIRLRRPGLVAEALDTGSGRKHARGRMRRCRRELGPPARVEAVGRSSTVVRVGRVRQLGGDTWEFAVPLRNGSAAGEWDVRAVDEQERTKPLEWPIDVESQHLGGGKGSPARWYRSPRGHVQLSVGRSDAEVLAVEAEGETVRVRLQTTDGPHRLESARLSHDDCEVSPLSVAVDHGIGELVFPLRSHLTGDRPSPLPSGDWALILNGVDEMRHAAPSAPALRATLPREEVLPTHRMRTAIAGQRELRIELSAPLRDDEVSARDQSLIRQAYAGAAPVPERSVLFLADPAEARHARLSAIAGRLDHPGLDLRRYWAVPDLAAELPSEAAPIVIGSREWYDKLAAATNICTDAELEPYVRKRPHQRVVRVFDLDPQAAVGRTAWWDEGYTPGRIAEELERRAALWDLIVVPDESCRERYRREFAFDGPILVWNADSPERIVHTLLANERD